MFGDHGGRIFFVLPTWLSSLCPADGSFPFCHADSFAFILRGNFDLDSFLGFRFDLCLCRFTDAFDSVFLSGINITAIRRINRRAHLLNYNHWADRVVKPASYTGIDLAPRSGDWRVFPASMGRLTTRCLRLTARCSFSYTLLYMNTTMETPVEVMIMNICDEPANELERHVALHLLKK